MASRHLLLCLALLVAAAAAATAGPSSPTAKKVRTPASAAPVVAAAAAKAQAKMRKLSSFVSSQVAGKAPKAAMPQTFKMPKLGNLPGVPEEGAKKLPPRRLSNAKPSTMQSGRKQLPASPSGSFRKTLARGLRAKASPFGGKRRHGRTSSSAAVPATAAAKAPGQMRKVEATGKAPKPSMRPKFKMPNFKMPKLGKFPGMPKAGDKKLPPQRLGNAKPSKMPFWKNLPRAPVGKSVPGASPPQGYGGQDARTAIRTMWKSALSKFKLPHAASLRKKSLFGSLPRKLSAKMPFGKSKLPLAEM